MKRDIVTVLNFLSMKDLRTLARENGVSGKSRTQLINQLLFLKQRGGARFNEAKMRQKYEQQLKEKSGSDEDLINRMRKVDPSPTGEYTEWIIKSYLDNGIKRLEDLESRVTPALKNFMILTSSKLLDLGDKPWNNEYNLDNFLGITGGLKRGRPVTGLEDLIDKYQIQLQPSKREVKEQKRADLKLVYENDLVKMYHPKTRDAACYIGQGTRWCTAATESNNMFDRYNKDGPLYVIVPKTPKYSGEKYQFHHKIGQYMNEKDEPVDPLILFDRFNLGDEIANINVYKNYEYPDNHFTIQEEHFPLIKKYADKFTDLAFYDFYESNIRILNKLFSNPSKFNNLKRFTIADSDINVPDFITKFNNLLELHLDGNQLTILPESIGQLKNLRKLELYNNELTILPESIEQLEKLEVLDLSINQLTSLPEFIGQLKNLQKLLLNSNELTILPESIGQLKNLRALKLHNNQLTSLPESIEQLEKLEVLDLSANQFTSLPELIGHLKNLQKLLLLSNRLTSFPKSLDMKIFIDDKKLLHQNQN